MTFDPIAYRGGPLRFTSPADEAMRSVRSLVGYVELLSREYGRLPEESPGAREMAAEWAMTFTKVVGFPPPKFVDPSIETERLRELLGNTEPKIAHEPADASNHVLVRPEQVVATARLVGRDLAAAKITAHVHNVGDIAGSWGDWIGERGSGRWIEGFNITPPRDISPGELLCQVVLESDRYRRGRRPAGSAEARG